MHELERSRDFAYTGRWNCDESCRSPILLVADVHDTKTHALLVVEFDLPFRPQPHDLGVVEAESPADNLPIVH